MGSTKMYIAEHEYPVMVGEPQLGRQIEYNLIEEEDGEGLAILITYMADQQEVPTTFTAIDEFSDEDIELNTCDYLDNKYIDSLNAMFMDNNDWTEEQLTFLINLWEELDGSSSTRH